MTCISSETRKKNDSTEISKLVVTNNAMKTYVSFLLRCRLKDDTKVVSYRILFFQSRQEDTIQTSATANHLENVFPVNAYDEEQLVFQWEIILLPKVAWVPLKW